MTISETASYTHRLDFLICAYRSSGRSLHLNTSAPVLPVPSFNLALPLSIRSTPSVIHRGSSRLIVHSVGNSSPQARRRRRRPTASLHSFFFLLLFHFISPVFISLSLYFISQRDLS